MAEVQADRAGEPAIFIVRPDGTLRRQEVARTTIPCGLGPVGSSVWARDVLGLTDPPISDEFRELVTSLGFSWSSLSEPGHILAAGEAVELLARASRRARDLVRTLAARLGTDLIEVRGATLVDRNAASLERYLEFTDFSNGLYGHSGYFMNIGSRAMMLRHSGCIEKFSFVMRAFEDLRVAAWPVVVFEESDSFRFENEEELELLVRVRHFRLPEAHAHVRTLPAALNVGLCVDELVRDQVIARGDQVGILLTCTTRFLDAGRPFFGSLVQRWGDRLSDVILVVSPPGSRCEAGIEVGVEYKVLDHAGIAREMATFQIDRLLTESFALGDPQGDLHTVHVACSGSVERAVYYEIDRRFRTRSNSEGEGPEWVSTPHRAP